MGQITTQISGAIGTFGVSQLGQWAKGLASRKSKLYLYIDSKEGLKLALTLPVPMLLILHWVESIAK